MWSAFVFPAVEKTYVPDQDPDCFFCLAFYLPAHFPVASALAWPSYHLSLPFVPAQLFLVVSKKTRPRKLVGNLTRRMHQGTTKHVRAVAEKRKIGYWSP